MDLKLLTDYLMAASIDDQTADQKLDLLLAQIEPDIIANAVSELIETGPCEVWAGCMELLGILAGRFPQLWQQLILALETRTDLGTLDQLSGLALLKSSNRLPKSGQILQMASELVDLDELQVWTENSLIEQLTEGPDSALPILQRLGEMQEPDRQEVIRDLTHSAGPTLQKQLQNWFSMIPTDIQKQNKGEDGSTGNSEFAGDLRFSGWVTDLTAAGQFGAGIEFNDSQMGEVAHRFVLGGGWSQGVRLFDYAEADISEPGVLPQLPSGRTICTHPTLVKKWVLALLDQGWQKDFARNPQMWTAGYLRHELFSWTAEDQKIWENWTEILVDRNPVNVSQESLIQDAEVVCQSVLHWFESDPIAAELITEFTQRNQFDKKDDRWQSTVRIWFERVLGPKMQEYILRLQAMSFFWLATAESGLNHGDDWLHKARASARLSMDLSDPARVVAHHPFVQKAAEIAMPL